MKEETRGHLMDTDKPVSLDNLDFDTRIYLKRAERAGHSYEFGAVDRGDRTVRITIEKPDIKPGDAAVESPEEWGRKRQWYLRNAQSNINLLLEGISEGYLIEEEVGDWKSVLAGTVTSEYVDWECQRGRFASPKDNVQMPRMRSPRQQMLSALSNFAGSSVRKLMKNAQNPWQAYEHLKRSYCSKADSADEYDRRISEVVLALGV